MTSTAALIWYLVIAGPQGGMAVLPSTFDKREQCTAAIAEYQKQPTPAGLEPAVHPQRFPIHQQRIRRIAGSAAKARLGDYLAWRNSPYAFGSTAAPRSWICSVAILSRVSAVSCAVHPWASDSATKAANAASRATSQLTARSGLPSGNIGG